MRCDRDELKAEGFSGLNLMGIVKLELSVKRVGDLFDAFESKFTELTPLFEPSCPKVNSSWSAESDHES